MENGVSFITTPHTESLFFHCNVIWRDWAGNLSNALWQQKQAQRRLDEEEEKGAVPLSSYSACPNLKLLFPGTKRRVSVVRLQ